MRFSRVPVVLALVVAVAGLSTSGCNGRLERPPVEILQRESLLGAGKIIQIKSVTNETLTEIEVTVKADGRQMQHTELRLEGYEVVEVGWKKLGGWEIPDGAEIEVRAEGYLLPARARLTSGQDDNGRE